jgi:sodium transport system ATP-binding protein
MIEVLNLAKSFQVPQTAAPGGKKDILAQLGLKKKPKQTVQAVADVSFTAQNGSITGLLGPNGAGKTTSMRMLAGLITPDAGSMHVDGLDVARVSLIALKRMGVLADARGLYPRLTARENITYYGELHGMHKDEANARADELAELLDLKAILDRRTEGFSQGERMKTSLARALVHNPPNIILDEPTNGLDVLATRSLREALLHLKSDAGGSKCIVLSTHIMQEVERLCDVVYIVSRGRTVAQGSVNDLKRMTRQGDFEEAFVQLAFGEMHSAKALAPVAAVDRTDIEMAATAPAELDDFVHEMRTVPAALDDYPRPKV